MSKRNTFDLSHTVKLTGKMGVLIPLGCFEVYPADHFKARAALDIRFQALLRPLMHNIKYTVHYWFAPMRLAWKDWESFITGGENGDEAPIPPYITTDGTNNAEGTLMDFFGVPTGVSGLQVSALPFRAYNLIFNEWYRNQNVREKYAISLESGEDTTTDLSLKRRTWKPNDYFTNALPFLQRGPMVQFPLSGNDDIPVRTSNVDNASVNQAGLRFKRLDSGSILPGNHFVRYNVESSTPYNNPSSLQVSEESSSDSYTWGKIAPSNLVTSLSDGDYGILVNVLRQGLGVQHLLEKFARSGARMVEVIQASWKVRSSDARLQRPEFLGGGSRPIVVSQVLQTSATENDGTPQANPAGFAQSLSVTPQFNKAFEEWGYIIPILSVMPQSDYMQGLAKMWTRKTRFEYAWPDLAKIGDQAIYNREIYAQGTSEDNGIFGYTPRYEELRKMPNRVCGQFRSTLDFWHMARKFSDLPVLSSDFCECTPDEQRVFAVEGEDNLLVECLHEMYATRNLPRLGSPGIQYV